MNLAPLKYKDYTWPVNPTTCTVRYEKNTAIHHYPGSNFSEVDDLGMRPREISGTGEFIGSEAYNEFKRLNSEFCKLGPGPLVHPTWNIPKAVFQKLEVEQDPTPNYVKYSFTFIEHIAQREIKQTNNSLKNNGVSKKKIHIVKKGECLYSIAKKYNTNLKEILKKNKKIKNPNLIYPGQKIVV